MFRKPTVVNNIETLACVTHIVDRGVEWFKIDRRAARSQQSARPRQLRPEAVLPERPRQSARLLRSAAGHHRAGELIDEYGGGVWKGRKAKAAIPGGISMGLLTEAEFDTPLDFTGPGKVGCLGLGTAAVVVLDETVLDGRFPAQQLPLLRPRKLRPMHALPRRHALGAARCWSASRPARGG